MTQKRERIARAVDVGFGFVKYTNAHLETDSQLGAGSFASLATELGDPSVREALMKQDVMVIEIDGLGYAVGKDVIAIASGKNKKVLEASFFKSNEYLALFRGALTQMNVPSDGVIDKLVTGLPLNFYRDKSIIDHIKAVTNGKHEVPTGGGTRTIHVKTVDVVPQVMGSLVALATPRGDMEALRSKRNLTIDVGYGTMLWLVSDGLRPNPLRSNGNMGGVSALLEALMRSIEPRSATHVGILDRLDMALINGDESVETLGKTVKIAPHLPRMDSIITSSIAEMMRSVGAPDDIQNVYLTGGGAHLYRAAVAAALPEWEIIEQKSGGQFMNVRGFQMLAEDEED